MSFGVTLGLLPMWIPLGLLVASYLFFSLVVRVEPNRWRSIVTFVCFGLGCVVWLQGSVPSFGCLLAAGIVTFRHLEPELEEEKASARFMPGRPGPVIGCPIDLEWERGCHGVFRQANGRP